MDWLFDYARIDDACRFHDTHGFVGVRDVFTPVEFAALRDGVGRAEATGRCRSVENSWHQPTTRLLPLRKSKWYAVIRTSRPSSSN